MVAPPSRRVCILANVTFSSPVMAKDLTVYAVAGHRGTILAVARSHKIPIPFDCQDGECGSCLVKVEHLAPNVKYGIALTEKEKEMLRQLGKITSEQLRDAEVNDMPPPYRLACQCFVRDEDILVSFEGDRILPVQRPYLSIAAKIYKGGIEIKSLDQFLGFAVKLEEDAAIHYEELGTAMEECGNLAVAQLFRELAGYSRLHLAQAQERAGSTDVYAASAAGLCLAGPYDPGAKRALGGRPGPDPFGCPENGAPGRTPGVRFLLRRCRNYERS